MKTTILLKISAEEFFKYIVSGLTEEIKAATGSAVSEEELRPGMEFERPSGRNTNDKCVILSFLPDKAYSVRIERPTSSIILSYQLEAVSAEKVKVTFSQSVLPERHVRVFDIVNAKLAAKIRLQNIESAIIAARHGKQEEVTN